MNLTVDLQVCGILFLLAVLVAAWFFGSNWKQRLGWFFAIAVAGGVGGALCAAGPLALLQPVALSAPGVAAFLTGIFLLALATGYLRYYKFRPLRRMWLALVALPVLGALVWGGTLGIGVIRYHAAQKEFDRTVPPVPAAPVPNGAELYVEVGRAWRSWLDADQERWGDFPCSGVNAWIATPSGEQEISPERKKAAVDLIFSAELEPIIAEYADATRIPAVWYTGQTIAEILPVIMNMRSVSRYFCDRAWGYHHRKQYELILPELRKILPGAASLRNQGVIIADLVGLAIQAMACHVAVQLGPVGPRYAADYRRMLEEFRKGCPLLSNESRFCVDLIGERLERNEDPGDLNKPNPDFSKVELLLNLPLAWNRAATWLNELTGFQPELNLLIAADTLPEAEVTDGDLLSEQKDIYLKSLRKQHIFDRFNETGLALKLYRSEKGAYPETLEELVPEYLNAVPVDPVTGEPFYYRRTEKGFELDRPDANGKKSPLRPFYEVTQ